MRRGALLLFGVHKREQKAMRFLPAAIGLAGLVLAFAIVSGNAASPPRHTTHETLDPHDYQSFVGNWTPARVPLCAALRSQSDWNGVLHPAAIMGGNKPFSPPADFWNAKAVLLVSRVVDAGDTTNICRLPRLRRSHDAIELDYAFAPTPHASSTMKWYLAVAVAKPLPSTIRFREGGRTLCKLRPNAGAWVVPPLAD